MISLSVNITNIEVFKIGYFAAHARFPTQSEIDRFVEALEKEKENEQKN